jgi:lysophospholipase L1-like esterase
VAGDLVGGENVPLPVWAGATIVFFGDSITFGQYVDPRVRWTAFVESHLRRAGDDEYTYCVNRGVSGETSHDALLRFAHDVQHRSPDIVTIQFGLNDCNCWETDRGLPRVSERSFEANLHEMINRTRWFGCEEIILSTNHTTTRETVQPNGRSYEVNNRRYNAIIRSVAESAGVVLCDMEQSFARYAGEDLASLLLPYPDQLHLSENGNRVYFETIVPFVDAALRRHAEAG